MPKVTVISHEYEALTDALRVVMASRGILTIKELAERMHEPPQNVSNWLRGAQSGNVKAWQLESICKALKISVRELYNLAADPSRMPQNCARLIC